MIKSLGIKSKKHKWRKWLTLQQAVERIVAAEGCSEDEARKRLVEALWTGKPVAYGTSA